MNYAILTLTGTTVAQQMKEVARLVTGLVSTTADLLYATKASSTVVIDAPTSNWSLAALTPLEGGTTATSAGYAFTAPCQTATKTKSALLCASTVGTAATVQPGIVLMSGTGIAATVLPTTAAAFMTAIATVAGSAPSNTMFGYVTTVGTSAQSSTNGSGFLTNQSTIPNWQVSAIPLNAAANKLYVFWSSSAIIIAVNGQAVQMVGEFAETNLTRAMQSVPVCAAGPQALANSPATTSNSYYTNTTFAIAFNNLYSYSDGLNAYRPGNTLSQYLTYDRSANAVRSTVDSVGNQLTPIVPLNIPLQSLGHGTVNVSQLTNLYQTVSGTSTTGSILTVGSSRFMTLAVTQGTYLVKIN